MFGIKFTIIVTEAVNNAINLRSFHSVKKLNSCASTCHEYHDLDKPYPKVETDSKWANEHYEFDWVFFCISTDIFPLQKFKTYQQHVMLSVAAKQFKVDCVLNDLQHSQSNQQLKITQEWFIIE